MNRQELLKVLESYGIAPTRLRGQNFLIDKQMLEAMVASLDLQAGEQILEVGPGTGALTRMMLDAGCHVTAVEFDNKLHQYLSENLDYENFNLHQADACKVKYNEILDLDRGFRCISNLPYNISSIFVVRMLELPKPPEEMFFLLQKEMAERFSAKPHTKKYNSLTVRAAVLYKTKVLRKVPPQVFHPPPKVDSSYIHMKRVENPPAPERLKILGRVSKTAFSQRRKKALKLLSASWPADLLKESFAALGLREDIRAENITPQQYLQLADLLKDA